MSEPNSKSELLKNIKDWFHTFIGWTFIMELLAGLFLFLFFKTRIEELLKPIASWLFKGLRDNPFALYGALGLCILLIAGYIIPILKPHWKIPNLRTSPKSALILMVCSLAYLVLFRPSIRWSFISWGELYYADILLLVTSLNTFSWYRSFKSKQHSTINEGFQEDSSYQGVEEIADFDEYGYTNYAQKITDVIVKTYPKKSFAIGINGQWGSGKTSFMEIIARQVKESDTGFNIVRFNAWESSDAHHILPDFLNVLKGTAGLNNSYLSGKISEYAEKLSPVDKSGWLKTLQAFAPPKTSVAKLKSQISEILKQSGKRLLILIDDLDRLDKDELMAVYKLVRNSVNFPNVIFMLAYDREYVNAVTKDLTDYRSEFFLEKIINAEFQLPLILPQFLGDDLKEKLRLHIESEKLDESIKIKIIEQTDKTLLYSHALQKEDLFAFFIKNKRDVTRISNAMMINFKVLMGEVLFQDLFYLELIRMNYPEIYVSLQNNKGIFVELNPSVNSRAFHLKEKYSDSTEQPSSLITILNLLFPPKNEIKDDPNSLGIHIPSNYHKYFRYQLEKSDFSEVSYIKFRNGPLPTFKNQIETWVKEGLEVDLTKRFNMEQVDDFDNQYQFINFIDSVLFLSSLKPFNGNNPIIGLNIKFFQSIFLDVDRNLSARFFQNQEDFKNQIDLLFRSHDRIWQISKSEFIKRIYPLNAAFIKQGKLTTYSQEELLEMNISFLKSAIKHTYPRRFNRIIEILWLNCLNERSLDKNATELIKCYCFDNNIQHELFYSFIKKMYRSDDIMEFYLSNFWNVFFDSFDQFKEAVNKSAMIHKDEYIQFAELYESGNYKFETIEYEFTEPFSNHYNTFWENFNLIPEMPEVSAEDMSE